MIPLLALVAGFGFGWLRASRRGGSRADKWQYGITHGIAFALVTLFVAVVLYQTGLVVPQ